MANLKDIRTRIRSVKSTQKITQAMRMVAAAKVKRAENRVKAARPYSEELLEIFTFVYNELRNQTRALEGSRYLELLAPRPVKNVGVIVISSDRGLCGSYNSTVIRQGLKLEKDLLQRGLTPKFYLVGSKVVQSFSRYSQADVLGRMSGMTSAPSIHHANEIAERMTQAFLAGEIDAIAVLSTHFVSMISYKTDVMPLIPVRGQIEIFPDPRPKKDALVETDEHIDQNNLRPEILLEPDPVATLDRLVPMFLSNYLYRLLLEASASELAARMTSMTNASKNAGEMIDKLTLVYNKARQAKITQEILEIVGGAEALG